MATEILLPSEEPIIKKIIEAKNQIQLARSYTEKQWLVNLAFLYGKQHFLVENNKIRSGLDERIVWELKSEERKNKTKRSSNYILPLYRSLLARMLQMKAHISVEPMTSTQSDKSNARVAQEVLEDHWQMVNKNNPLLCRKYAGMLRILAKLFASLLSCGSGYLMPYFNANTVAKGVFNSEIITAEIGEVETKVFTPFDVFEDRLGMFTIVQEVLPVDTIKSQYGVEVTPDELTNTEPEQELLNMLEGGEERGKIENGAKTYQYWKIPNDDEPEGKFVIVTGQKIIYDGALPSEYKGRVPMFGFDYLDLLLSAFPQAFVEQLIPLQEEYNYTLSRLYAYKKWFAGKLKVPKGCALETKYDDEIGQIIYYKPGVGEPHFEAPPSPPAFLGEDLIRIRKDMEDIGGVHDSNMSPSRYAGKSGIAIDSLNELDNSQLMPILMSIETQLEFYCETVLDIIEAKYSEKRILNISGENLGSDVATFSGAEVKGNRRIKINLGSALPMAKSDRQAFLMMLADKGYIDRTKALELMEFGDLAGAYISVDENAQKQEISNMLKGQPVEVMDIDFHPTHLHTLEQFMKGESFKSLNSEIKQLLDNHYRMHQKYLMLENRVGQNTPPPIPPLQQNIPQGASNV